MSIDLATLQSQFSHFVLQGDDQIKAQIVSTQDLKSDLRLAIYANAYVARMVETLQNDFPALHYLLGEESFYQLGTAYTRHHPSVHPSLNGFGQHVVSFIQTSAVYTDRAYLAEVAQLEWSLSTAFRTTNATSITEADVATLPAEKWPELCFEFDPSVMWFSYHWNVIALWNAVKNKQDIPDIVKLDVPEKCVVWRQDLRTMFRTLEPVESEVLPLVMENISFGELCELMSEHSESPENVPMQAAGLLKAWINNGFIIGLHY